MDIVLQVLPELIKTNNAICKVAKSLFLDFNLVYLPAKFNHVFKASTRHAFSSLKSRMIKIFVLQSALQKLDPVYLVELDTFNRICTPSRCTGFLHS